MRRLATQLARQLPAPPDSRPDGDLLAGFLIHANEDDFAELVRRHGPLVWGACRRVLPDPTDAEDAFQATFLVLVRRGRKLTSFATIGPWLHRVAVWTARNVRRRNARRFAKQTPLTDQLPAGTTDRDLPLDLDAALLALPEKFRSPIVLCHLLGFSRADAAARLGCPEGTLSAWLSRGLAKLRTKLGGLDPAKPLGLATVTVPAALMSSAVRAAVASRAAFSAAVSSTVSSLVDGVIRMFWVQKATAASAALVAVFALGMGIGLTARHGVVAVAEGQEKAAPQKADANPQPKRVIPPRVAEELLAIDRHLEDLKARYDVLMIERKELASQFEYAKRKAEENSKRIQEIQDAADQLAAVRKKLQERPPAPAAPKREVPAAEVADIDTKLAQMRIELQKLAVKRDSVTYQRAHLDEQEKELESQEKPLRSEFDALAAKRAGIAAKPGGYLELTLKGDVISFYELMEKDSTGKVIGCINLWMDYKAIGKALVRMQKDPTAPKELRFTLAPTERGGLVLEGLKACEAAGFKSIKFTGYMPQEKSAPVLKRDQTGAVKGYKHYDGVECTTANLIKEYEDWDRLK